jgi:pyrimidine-nucleoside phosphorylase
MAESAIARGAALERFRTMVATQGGDVAYVDDPSRLPEARLVEDVTASRAGTLSQVHARLIGEAAVRLGAGRAQKGDKIDHAVGVLVHHKIGDRVEQGDALFTIHANDEGKLRDARDDLLQSVTWSDAPVPAMPLFYGVVTVEKEEGLPIGLD